MVSPSKAESSRGDKNDTRTKVFLSYSRADTAFVRKLAEALRQLPHLQVFKDTDDILPTEEWRIRLEGLIGQAHTIVFCISPHSVASDVCAWEVDLAQRLNKRIVPIVLTPVSGRIPEALEKRNQIFFVKTEDFNISVGYLVTALDLDISWIREHTRIDELARHWLASNRRSDRLLRGSEIGAVENWLNQRPRNAPTATAQTIEFIQASREDDRKRNRRLRIAQAAFAILMLCFVLGGFVWRNQSYALNSFYWFKYVRGSTLPQADEFALKPGSTFTECLKYCPEMIVIPSGNFIMGAPPDVGKGKYGPEHNVSLRKVFAVSRYEITFKNWNACVRVGSCKLANDMGWTDEKRPVINVSWFDANDYVAWLNSQTGKSYRLLSESEWEYVARAGSVGAYSWGNDLGKNNANCDFCGSEWDGKQTSPVGSFKANAFGVYDMHGNVWEWVADPWHSTYRGAPEDGSVWKVGGDQNYVVLRGGAWQFNPDRMHVAVRLPYAKDYRYWNLGFRLARDLNTR
jgi:formylglycine-generating enzyme required for sulfatase activity